MGTTAPGGRYLVGGRLVDANGVELAPAPDPPAATIATAVAWLPEGFPHRAALHAAGFVTLDHARSATDAELRAVKGVGPAGVRAIRDAL